jgi:hypothetical protein
MTRDRPRACTSRSDRDRVEVAAVEHERGAVELDPPADRSERSKRDRLEHEVVQGEVREAIEQARLDQCGDDLLDRVRGESVTVDRQALQGRQVSTREIPDRRCVHRQAHPTLASVGCANACKSSSPSVVRTCASYGSAATSAAILAGIGHGRASVSIRTMRTRSARAVSLSGHRRARERTNVEREYAPRVVRCCPPHPSGPLSMRASGSDSRRRDDTRRDSYKTRTR